MSPYSPFFALPVCRLGGSCGGFDASRTALRCSYAAMSSDVSGNLVAGRDSMTCVAGRRMNVWCICSRGLITDEDRYNDLVRAMRYECG
jgi:hypothetical protein